MTIRLKSENRNRKRRIDLSKINKAARRTLTLLGLKNAELNLIFISSQKIRVLNRRYFGIDASTDVIAWPSGKFRPRTTDNRGQTFIGDIAVSSDKAARNAREYGQTFKEELVLYVVHGILHLAGYEDTSRMKREKMRRKENETFQKVRRYI
jgi:probable rRNA maturation factor